MMEAPLLRVDGLVTEILTPAGPRRILDGVCFDIAPGEVVALVGESGSGKSMTMQAITGLLPQPAIVSAGSALFQGCDLLRMPARALRALRGDRIGMIFQEPMSALNPMMPVGDQIAETLTTHRGLGWQAARGEAVRLLDRVRVVDAARVARLRPHELSGGMRQRVVIGAAIACKPALIIADEPTTALDASVQAEIITLLNELRHDVGCAILLITHDIGLVGAIADKACVMLSGRIVESGPAASIIMSPRTAYARTLVAASLPPTQPGRPPVAQTEPVLEVRDLTVSFALRRSLFARGGKDRHIAVDRANLSLRPGETLALVGESGSGKTTLARAILGLAPIAAGSIQLHGVAPGASRTDIASKVQFVFQDPQASLNPLFPAWRSVSEPLHLAGRHTAPELKAHAEALLLQVGLGPDTLYRFPHELSGGQRQRLGIARALIRRPHILIADEAVAALDASTRMQILDLLLKLQAEHSLAYLFITHDLSVVARIAHRVAVMRHGRIVETDDVATLFYEPKHPYTKLLLDALPGVPSRMPQRNAAHISG
jgi:peptide/nickel transport system ATP-binding protein